MFGYLAAPRGACSALVRERLLRSLLERRAALLGAAIGSVALALSAVYFTGANWPRLWLAADLGLVLGRWRIMVQPRLGTVAEVERCAATLMLLGAVWSLLLGLAICASLAAGEPALIALSVMLGAGATSAITSRNAATPRHAMLCMALILVPLAGGALLSPHRGMASLTLLAPFWFASLAVMLSQNHSILARLLEAELKARTLAETDTLTTLYNRQYLNDHFEQVIRHGDGYSLLYFDLDDFKAVNDKHGHLVGDTLLRIVADRIRGAIRLDDLSFRMGGDEFLIVLHVADPKECDRVAERLIEAIATPCVLSDGLQIEIRASVGSTCAHNADNDLAVALHTADTALYRAKAAGKGGHVHAA